MPYEKPSFFERAVQLDRILQSLGRDFLVGMLSDFGPVGDVTAAHLDAAKQRWRTQKLNRTRPKPCLPGYINIGCCVITGLLKPRSGTSAKCYLAAAGRICLGLVTRREEHWDESVAHFEQALALDPRACFTE
jgi:hypothetical protein